MNYSNDKHCPACHGAAESYFSNGYVCKICGRRESAFLRDIARCASPSSAEPFDFVRIKPIVGDDDTPP